MTFRNNNKFWDTLIKRRKLLMQASFSIGHIWSSTLLSQWTLCVDHIPISGATNLSLGLDWSFVISFDFSARAPGFINWKHTWMPIYPIWALLPYFQCTFIKLLGEWMVWTRKFAGHIFTGSFDLIQDWVGLNECPKEVDNEYLAKNC